MARKKREIWPFAIILAFVLFISSIITAVVIMGKQDVNMVSEDYYADEVLYQDQIDRMTITKGLKKSPVFELDRETGMLSVHFQKVNDQTGRPEGDIEFFRPSDDRLDRKVPINTDGKGLQQIEVKNFPGGFWRVKILWKEGEVEYYHEQPLNL